MPGFNIQGVGNGPNATAEIRRVHRWVFEAITTGSSPVPQNVMLFLKSAGRPTHNLEEAIMHHNQEQVYYAGKTTWEPITFSYYDAQQDPNVSQAMWTWMNNCVQYTGGNAPNVAPPANYKSGIAKLNMVDGSGAADESWEIYNGWPQNINWNASALDYTSSELMLIEVKFRYDRAIRTV